MGCVRDIRILFLFFGFASRMLRHGLGQDQPNSLSLAVSGVYE